MEAILRTIIITFGLIGVLGFTSKLLLHLYLDYNHGKSIDRGSAFFLPIDYILPYKNAVEERYSRAKAICNLSLIIGIIGLIANIILGMLS